MSTEPSTSQALVQRVPIPKLLADVGVQIVKDVDSEMSIVLIPPGVREKVNVLDPVSSFAQADPNWTPAIRIVQLDKTLHTFKVASKNALNKQGLETLAKAAGILYARTERIPTDQLGPDEKWGYRATIGIRRSDGSIEEITREKGSADDGDDAKFGRAKTESKAVLRAIRAALQIPHGFSDADLAKPFLVIGYSFTPDYNDEETKRLLIAAGLNAQAAIYGTHGAPSERLELEASPSSPDGAEPSPAGPHPQGPGTGGESQQAEAAVTEVSPPAAASVPGPDLTSEPSLDEAPAQTTFAAPADVRDEVEETTRVAMAAGETKIPAGNYAGMTLRQVAEKGGRGEGWLAWALREWKEPVFRQQLETYTRVMVPDAWAKFQASLQEEGTP